MVAEEMKDGKDGDKMLMDSVFVRRSTIFVFVNEARMSFQIAHARLD
jgi:hypothetical protein